MHFGKRAQRTQTGTDPKAPPHELAFRVQEDIYISKGGKQPIVLASYNVYEP